MPDIDYHSNTSTSAPDGYYWYEATTSMSMREYNTVEDIPADWVNTVQEHWGNNYSFKEWNTERDGSGTAYHTGDKVYEDTTLYTIWNGETLMPKTMEILKGDKRYWLNVLTNFERTKISNALTSPSVREYDVVDYSSLQEWESGNSYEVGDRVKYTSTIFSTTNVKGYVCIVANSSDEFDSSEWEYISKFPETGEINVIYIAMSENKAYYWDVIEEEYVCISGDAEGKADKVVNATSGNFAALDSNGNLTDSGHKHSDYLTSHQDITGKADKVTSATSGNLAALDSNGNLIDSGKSANDFMEEMTILAYGTSTWADFEEAYTGNRVVYCRASSNSNPATGAQNRLAFMAYVNNASTPTEVEFQYYRSVSSHTASQQGDQVYVYKLNKTSGWTVTTREASVKVVAGTNITGTYSNGTMTISGNYSAFTGADSGTAGSTGLVPAPSAGDEDKFLKGDGTWGEVNTSSSTVSKVSFTIATTDWTQSSNTYVADVTDSHITSTTEELIMYTNSVKNLTSDIDTNKDGTNNKITFIVDSVPTGDISGSIYIISQGNIVADTKVDIDQGVENAGKFLVVNSQGNVEPVTMQAWQGGSY